MLDGDEAAFESFFDAVYPALYRFALARLGGDADAAGDVAQAAHVQGDREAAHLSWRSGAAHMAVHLLPPRDLRLLHAATRRTRTSSSPRTSPRSGPHSNRCAPRRSRIPTRRSIASRLAAFVQRVLDQLPSHYADALEWKYIDEVPVQEIASRLGLGLKAAESLLTRARAAFRDAFRTLAAGGPPPFQDRAW